MWGCFLEKLLVHIHLSVFPTHVGVFPASMYPDGLRLRLPHACGGVSMEDFRKLDLEESSPRMWGGFVHAQRLEMHAVVFPTHVGVFLHERL